LGIVDPTQTRSLRRYEFLRRESLFKSKGDGKGIRYHVSNSQRSMHSTVGTLLNPHSHEDETSQKECIEVLTAGENRAMPEREMMESFILVATETGFFFFF
jgi:hypothetical protein